MKFENRNENFFFTGDPGNFPPPPPLRETIFSTEIRSVEYEKPEEQRETVLFDDIGELIFSFLLFVLVNVLLFVFEVSLYL